MICWKSICNSGYKALERIEVVETSRASLSLIIHFDGQEQRLLLLNWGMLYICIRGIEQWKCGYKGNNDLFRSIF